MADSTYKMIITAAGKNRMLSAISTNSTIKITQIAVGDGAGTAYTPTADMTALKRETWRGNVNQVARNPDDTNIIVITGIIPFSAGGFFVREIGIFDDQGTMLAVGNYPECYKPTQDSGCSKDMTIEVWIILSDEVNISLTVDPSVVTATKKDLQDLKNDVDTEFDVMGSSLAQQMLQNKRVLADLEGEINTITLSNSQTYPFNDSKTTVALSKSRDTLNYRVVVETVSETGGSAGKVSVSDKALNGFKIAFDGSASSVTLKYYIEGGMFQ